ncbi:aminotransferase class V-fold PLP-dependent enzyme [Fischerella sp. PCC 9605]|uniref:aminotransferase class V-fold PLP-dependent enzyme n=1 Tax=Fischerella sp. PCC 9605 TaxID=1173024 RepID=UPI00047D525E|nr:aminotransferase class V-fold PLP-dependent enzyme [Fischerella sp. PCC 9605]
MTSISVAKTRLHLHRQQFPALVNKTYFNYGGQGPMPQVAMDAITQAQAYIQEIGPFGTEVGAWILQEVKAIRVAIASELHVPPETITLTENVTVGCNIAMWGIDWYPGDHLLLSNCEHPGIVAIAQEIGRRFGVEVTTCPLMATLNEGDPVAVVAQHLRPNTRLVVLSHILWNTGQVLPLDKIVEACRHNQNRLLVDAAQSVGSLPLNLTELGADFYAFTGHKWLCGPAGIGGLYVRPEVRESLQPTFIGWRSAIANSQGQPVDWYPDGKRYEVATSNYPLYTGLREAIAVHQQWGTAQERYQQICHNSEYLWRRLATLSDVHLLRTSPPESGLVSFQLTQNNLQAHLQLVNFLQSKKLFTRTIADPSCVRACVHYFTLESEIDQLVEEIQEWLVVSC